VNLHNPLSFKLGLGLVMLGLSAGLAMAAEQGADYYQKEHPLFSTRPDSTASITTIKRFGPIGMALELHQPAFVMKIKSIEEGSPAATTGELEKGQIIESINGEKLADIDPRFQLGQIVAEAEATDGKLRMMVKDKKDAEARPVTVKIPAIGRYSDSWPLHDAKSDRIVRDLADQLAEQQWEGSIGIQGLEMLFLLSTGREQDLEVVRQWAHKTVERYQDRDPTNYAWYIGYGGIPLAEYYLRTGDETVLPLLQELADHAKETQYLGGWAGRGGVAWGYMGVGHLNAAGTNVLTFLLLAKECGVDVDKHTLHSALRQFYRFAGRGNNPYGDHHPNPGFIDNGKTGTLAFAMAAAASLTPEGEDSVYAQARDICAIKGFYTTSYMLHGHTGGGIGEIWRGAAMGLMYHKRPKYYRQFMDNRKWFYDLSRRFNGRFGILGGGGYDQASGGKPWGIGMALSYTIPRKTLQISGAPDTPYCHDYKLPEQPWGTDADEAFLSIEPAERNTDFIPGQKKLTLADDSAAAILRRLNDKDVNPKTVRYYTHHHDYSVRKYAAERAAGVAQNRLGRAHWKSAPPAWGKQLILDLLQSEDPRLRRAGIAGLRQAPNKLLNDRVFNLLAGMINAPNESWWVVEGALQVMQHSSADQLDPHVDRLLSWMEHDAWWLREAALSAVSPLVTDQRHYEKVLPAIGDLMLRRRRAGGRSIRKIVAQVKRADPAVQALAREMLGRAYKKTPESEQAYGGHDLSAAVEKNVDIVARTLAEVPGGYDRLYEVAQQRFPNTSLPHKNLYLGVNDRSRFSQRVRQALNPIIRNKLIPEYIGKHRGELLREARWAKRGRRGRTPYPIGKLSGLAGLYREIGVHQYDWQRFGPELRDMKWFYHTFDPPNQPTWDTVNYRYREVAHPEGMDNWYATDFDPKQAGIWAGRRSVNATASWSPIPTPAATQAAPTTCPCEPCGTKRCYCCAARSSSRHSMKAIAIACAWARASMWAWAGATACTSTERN
jgi:hypothetical protein